MKLSRLMVRVSVKEAMAEALSVSRFCFSGQSTRDDRILAGAAFESNKNSSCCDKCVVALCKRFFGICVKGVTMRVTALPMILLSLACGGSELEYDCSFESHGLCVIAEGAVDPSDVTAALKEAERQINEKKPGLDLDSLLRDDKVVATLSLDWEYDNLGFIKGRYIFARNLEDCYHTLQIIVHEVLHYVAEQYFELPYEEHHDYRDLFAESGSQDSVGVGIASFLYDYCSSRGPILRIRELGSLE